METVGVEARTRVRDFLLQRSGLDEIGEHRDIIGDRLLDSIAFIELILLIRSASGANISMEEINFEQFRTLESIYSNFFKTDSILIDRE